MQRLQERLVQVDFTVLFDRLLRWYDDEKRILPWRADGTPYLIWLSEIMLQQTRVETVIPYYERFVSRFPTLEALAAADEQAVLSLWQGLGYYSRARNLLRGAKWVQQACGGAVPHDLSALLKVPGIGPYTAGAILSMAYNQAVPAMDGNLCRIFSRLWQLDGDMAQGKTRDVLAKALTPYWETSRPGDVNQGLMDLSSKICTVNNPFCSDCPLGSFCLAKQNNVTDQYPVRKKKKPSPIIHLATAVLCQPDGRCLLTQRNRTGLLAGLWEFISAEGDNPEDAWAHLEKKLAKLGLEWEKATQLGNIKHIFTHRTWEMQIFRLTPALDLPANPAACNWLPLTDLDTIYLLAGPHRKIAAWLKGDLA